MFKFLRDICELCVFKREGIYMISNKPNDTAKVCAICLIVTPSNCFCFYERQMD